MPLSPPTIHYLSDEFMLIGPVIDTVDSVGFRIHTILVTVYTKYN